MSNSYQHQQVYLVFMTSVIFHLVLVLVLTLWGLRSWSDHSVLLELESVSSMEELDDFQFELPDEVEANAEENSSLFIEELVSEVDLDSLDIGPKLQDLNSTDVAGSGKVVSGATSADFERLVASLNANGLDLVIVFDSTSSMGSEVYELKEKIRWMSSKLLTVVENTRIGIGSYKDIVDDAIPGSFAVSGVPLTDRPEDLFGFLNKIRPVGGGYDIPEAVDRGMHWATTRNTFRPNACKVILLFGDAPPYVEKTDDCVQTAAKFKSERNGRVSTVTCKRATAFVEFKQIAKAGGGEALIVTDASLALMTELLVLVFGTEYRDYVLKATGINDE